MATWTNYAARIVPGWLQGRWGEGLVGVFGLVADLISEGAGQALKAPWLREPTSLDDAVALVGAERSIPRYPGESAEAYRARVVSAWSLHANGGTPARIDEEIATAGLDGMVFLRPSHPGPSGVSPWWSQFWVFTTETDPTAVDTMRGIVRTFKPVDWLFRGFVFDVDAPGNAIAEHAVGEEAI